MILNSVRRAFFDIFSPGVRPVLWKTLGLTILALVAMWFAVKEALIFWAVPWIEPYLPGLPDWAGWLGAVAGVIWAMGLAVALAFMIAPVSAIMAGFFLDDAADVVEKQAYPSDAPGTPLPPGQSLLASLRFFLIVIAANVVALFFLLVPGINLMIFFLVNGYLLGREYFEFAASRHLGLAGARDFRRRNRGKVTITGFLIALFLFIPILNLLTPLFAAATMVHLFKAMRKTDAAVR